MIRVIVMIDGGHLRVRTRHAGHDYNPDFIEKVAHACVDHEVEALIRILYYDCAPFQGETKLPVSGKQHVFYGDDRWLKSLAAKDLFAVRRGVLKFRGFKPKRVPISPTALTDEDFLPDFEQKGVDMRIGLDIAAYSEKKLADRVILITGDTDCIPAMKHGRKAGLQIVLVSFSDGPRPAPELLWHADYHRRIPWPGMSAPISN